jgi:hypothetical protein
MADITDGGISTGKVEPPAKAEPTLEETVAALKAQLAEKDRQIDEVTRVARQNGEMARSAVTEKADSDLTLVTQAIASHTRDLDILEETYAVHMANGDFSAAAKAQREMARTSAELLQLEQGKAAMEAQPKTEVRTPTPPGGYGTPSNDPVEAMARSMERPPDGGKASPRSAMWIREHPEFARDPRLTQRMLAAHNLAVTDGHQVDTDEYFEAVEKVLGLRLPGETPPAPEPRAPARTPRETQPPPASARSASPTGKRITLTAEQREIAAQNDQTEEEYAAALQALVDEGRIRVN